MKKIEVKKDLRFNKGDIVYIISDVNRKNPMTISEVMEDQNYDYKAIWLSPQRKLDGNRFDDETLML